VIDLRQIHECLPKPLVRKSIADHIKRESNDRRWPRNESARAVLEGRVTGIREMSTAVATSDGLSAALIDSRFVEYIDSVLLPAMGDRAAV